MQKNIYLKMLYEMNAIFAGCVNVVCDMCIVIIIFIAHKHL